MADQDSIQLDQVPQVCDPHAALPRRALRWAGSLLILLHLAAVVLPPLSFQTRGPLGVSPVVRSALSPLEGYGQFLYVDRGYAFFAPDPGPSHLIQAAITGPDGQRVEQMIPNLANQRPRLLYHRHFMLSEYLHSVYQQPGPPDALIRADPAEAEVWRQLRRRYETIRQSIVHHLKHIHPGREVAIRRIEHLIPNLAEFLEQPTALEDERFYRVLLDTPPSDMPPSAPPTSNTPASVLSPARRVDPLPLETQS